MSGSTGGTSRRPRVVIIGAGFGGLHAARTLRRAPVEVVVIDRTNHHLFQPLLYQVATGVLSPADIASPIRFLLRKQANASVLMEDVIGVDTGVREVRLASGETIDYDYLILAAGARHAYFGHPEWEEEAPGLKDLKDAREIRRRLLVALEEAELTDDPAEREALMTLVVVGAGPTGVELAGLLPEIVRQGMRHDFRRIDVSKVRVMLLEGGPRVLPSFPESLSRRARSDLQALGVEVRTEAIVTRVEPDAVHVGEERIPTRTVLWAAGNQASPLTRLLDAPVDRVGRVLVSPHLSIPGHPEVFVIGDAAAVPLEPVDEDPAARSWQEPERTDASLESAAAKREVEAPPAFVPAVAPAATQMGKHAGRMIARDLQGDEREPFRYRDKGQLATIGRNRAIAQIGRFKLTGRVAWVFWLFVHLMYLVGFRNRLIVFLEWAYAYATHRPGARLITVEDRLRAEEALTRQGSR